MVDASFIAYTMRPALYLDLGGPIYGFRTLHHRYSDSASPMLSEEAFDHMVVGGRDNALACLSLMLVVGRYAASMGHDGVELGSAEAKA